MVSREEMLEALTAIKEAIDGINEVTESELITTLKEIKQAIKSLG